MASEAKTSLVINGVDRTAGAFASIGARAAACGSQLKGMLGGALAAAGAYMGFSKISEGISELSHLSDIATKANTSVDDLTKTATAMDVLGIQNMGVDQFAKSLDYMQKTTGRVGMEGFYQTIQELAGIEDRAKRGQEAMRIFGRSGMEFMPLINGAENGIQALQGVIDVMPAIPQSAAVAGDNVADATGIVTNGIKSIWLQSLGAICGYFDTMFEGGVKTAALMAANWMEYYAKVGASRVIYYYGQAQNFMGEIGTFWGTLFGGLMNGGSISEAINLAASQMDLERTANRDAEAEELASLERRQAAWRAAYEEKMKKISEFNSNESKASISAEQKAGIDGLTATETAKKLPRITNKLIGAGSNEARKLSIFGPTLQTETKKQTKLLEKIAKNTENAADKDAVELDVLDN